MGDVTAVGMDTVTEKSGHQVTGMAVRVCITPAAPAPLPIPYPTMGTVAEGIVDEPMRTKINGAKHATVGSCVKVCHGNEPGAMKEVVSLNTSGPSFLLLGAPTVFCELGMMGITGSLVQMNKAITVGAPGSASGAGGAGAGGGGGGDGGGSGGDASNPNGPSGGGGSGGDDDHEGAAPPAAGAPAGQEGQADAGHPVDVLTGTMFTPTALDWLLPGLLEVAMLRSYRTSAVGQGVGIGRGWSHSLAWRARRSGQTLTLIDHEHRALDLPLPEPGKRVLLPYGRSVERQEDAILVSLGDDLVRLLRPSVEGDAAGAERGVPTQYVLAQVRDGHGHFAELEWTGGEVSRIVDSVGRVATFHVDGFARTWTLTLRDEAGKPYTRTLVSYELDARGDLVRVVDTG